MQTLNLGYILKLRLVFSALLSKVGSNLATKVILAYCGRFYVCACAMIVCCLFVVTQ